MKIILHEGSQYVLKFVRGEEVFESLKQFCRQEKISAGFFQGLGACGYLKLAYYDLETKNYQEREFNQDLEMANLTGNIATFENDLIVHMHGTFSDRAMKAFAGHVAAMKVAGTCELMLTTFSQPMTRKPDPGVGLNLLE